MPPRMPMIPSVGADPPPARPAEPWTVMRRKSVGPPAPVTVDVSTVSRPASRNACVTRAPDARAESRRASACSVAENVMPGRPSAHLLVPSLRPRRALLRDGAPVIHDELVELGRTAEHLARNLRR